jgi:hypothetical protein
MNVSADIGLLDDGFSNRLGDGCSEQPVCEAGRGAVHGGSAEPIQCTKLPHVLHYAR